MGGWNHHIPPPHPTPCIKRNNLFVLFRTNGLVFFGIVSRAMTLEVLSTGVAGNYNGALQVMTAELQLPTPLVPTRESYFVRYCKQHVDGTWAVVNVSLDNLRPSPSARCRRRPSGCLIQEMTNAYSKVRDTSIIRI
ncbi:Homeobox-leucine zipper protein MERISTEM L1 [Glycine soja]